LVSGIVCVILYRMNWSAVCFPLEHVLKVSAVASAVVLLTNAVAAVYRLSGGVALDFMNHPLVAPTPADFWRRWNVPAQQFLNEYTFQPAGGPRRPVRATLVTFAVSGLVHEYVFGIASGRVQGWQLLFFMIQGVAVVATMRVRPRGRFTLLWVAGTWGFNLASSALFFRSVNQVLSFYQTPDS
jgi:D-alanyl-lipoteichoic acid acyltransferase DltB (MBOAT superfamily)